MTDAVSELLGVEPEELEPVGDAVLLGVCELVRVCVRVLLAVPVWVPDTLGVPLCVSSVGLGVPLMEAV